MTAGLSSVFACMTPVLRSFVRVVTLVQGRRRGSLKVPRFGALQGPPRRALAESIGSRSALLVGFAACDMKPAGSCRPAEISPRLT